MKTNNTLYFIFLITFVLISNCFPQHASFKRLGDLPGGIFESRADKVSADGSVVAGVGTTSHGKQAFIWEEGKGIISLGNLSDSSFKESEVYGISADGKVVVGSGDPGNGKGWDGYKGYKWIQETGMIDMGCLNGSTRYEVFAASSDGKIIAGDGGEQAFIWTQDKGIEGLGVLPGRLNSRAIDISDDGSVIVGSSYNLPSWSNEQTYRWTKDQGMQALNNLPGTNSGFPNAISPDGSVITGTCFNSTGGLAYRWTKNSGMTPIGSLPGMSVTHPGDISANGKFIVGGSFSSPTNSKSFIWDSTNGMRDLKNVLQSEYGIDLTGWTLQNASGITPDGNVIVGWGINPSGNTEAFCVILDTLLTGIHPEKNSEKINYFMLEQNYPNPFNPETTISFQLQSAGIVTIKVFNLHGCEIATLVNEEKQPGNYSVKFEASHFASGVYFYCLKTGKLTIQKKMLLLR